MRFIFFNMLTFVINAAQYILIIVYIFFAYISIVFNFFVYMIIV